MKPNEGSYANNALKWGVAGLNIEGGRIGTEVIKQNQVDFKNAHGNNLGAGVKQPFKQEVKTTKGRYPSNLILDEEAGRLLDEQSGISKSSGGRTRKLGTSGFGKLSGNKNENIKGNPGMGDTGGASRFFYCAKASKAERDRGLIWMENVKGGTYQFRQDGSLDGKIPIKNNHHPTVKPLALMKYLVTLTKMPNPDQIYLDPFCGSGTTLMACKELKRDYIGIEKDKEYVEIANKRIRAIPETLF